MTAGSPTMCGLKDTGFSCPTPDFPALSSLVPSLPPVTPKCSVPAGVSHPPPWPPSASVSLLLVFGVPARVAQTPVCGLPLY